MENRIENFQANSSPSIEDPEKTTDMVMQRNCMHAPFSVFRVTHRTNKDENIPDQNISRAELVRNTQLSANDPSVNALTNHTQLAGRR